MLSDRSLCPEHKQFSQLCFDANLEIFVKIIVSQRRDPGELVLSFKLIASVAENVPKFLQLVTPLADSEKFS
ncbi:hypothetical protein [Anabaena sp. UHCC 0451]|uniref:hypothetical protein n=1 Tax=Anabaena sp. UHCC 0451 TaxID=2055235 RepID=UPI002B21EAB1|nr:hypothetical protein [Anabaena sp. UHCC 0451]MEA5578369.1 hypothetical protein [Anabaena sp. UHCC 0451]